MSNDDKRRRQDGSTAKLSVAELIARREAETQPIPRITERVVEQRATGHRASADEETVRFSATNLSGRELHITELLRREGRAGEEERGGGLSVPKLVAMASGGVVLAGTVAFSATNLLSSPDERPPAEVRFDARPAARATNTLTKDLGAAAAQQQAVQAQVDTTTATPDQPQRVERTTEQRAQRTTAQQPTATQEPQAQQQPTTGTESPTTSSPQTTTTAPSTSTTTPPPPSSSSQPPSATPSTSAPSTSTPPSSTPPSSTTPSTPPTGDDSPGIGLELDLGEILNPIGGFDFFAPTG
ncbi:hypothetical protein [Saccharothrix sp. HUAS TT1]|uniref:hypothetical protein n=1 Tax=unclassified Saccharothrix TaxID=2593673 RepID=UPI00345BB232